MFGVTEYNVGYVYKIRAGESIKTTNRDSFVVLDPEDKALVIQCGTLFKEIIFLKKQRNIYIIRLGNVLIK